MVKRVLVFSTDDHLYPAGGAEQAFGNITERLPHITFDLICARLRKRAPREEVVKNVHIHRLGFGIPALDTLILALFGHLKAYRLMKTHTYDLLWSIMASYGAFSLIRVKKRTGLPFLLTLQEGDPFEHIYHRVRYVRRSFNEIFVRADGIQAISNYLLQWGYEMGFKGRVGMVIPNGVGIERFTRSDTNGDVLRERKTFGFPDDAFILMTSSRLEPKNGIGDVIEALGTLPPHVCFVICGDGSLNAEIRARVKALGLESRVRFMGFVPPQDIPRIMHASDAFIRPSLSEGLGNAFLEAMVARLPVIGTSVGGIPDFLTDGETGFVVGAGDPESIVKGVRRVMELTVSDRTALLDRAERLVHERYDWKLISSSMETLFKTLTS